jgi:hypothetical protein
MTPTALTGLNALTRGVAGSPAARAIRNNFGDVRSDRSGGQRRRPAGSRATSNCPTERIFTTVTSRGAAGAGERVARDGAGVLIQVTVA